MDIGVLGYIGIVWPKEHSPEVWSVPPVTPCIHIYGTYYKLDAIKGNEVQFERSKTTYQSWMLDVNTTSETSEFVIICPNDKISEVEERGFSGKGGT